MDDELQRFAVGIALRVEHRNVKHHFGCAQSVAGHLVEADGLLQSSITAPAGKRDVSTPLLGHKCKPQGA